MYGSPCAVVVGYNHVRAAQSRKRNVAFAKLSGVCSICQAVHKYEIKDNPFFENADDSGKINYSAVEDLHVNVTVEGHFYIEDGKANISKPVHLPSNVKGLDLRGEERRLLAMKASVEGASSVYREGMAYMQKEQIESYNRTSVRSLPVIK